MRIKKFECRGGVRKARADGQEDHPGLRPPLRESPTKLFNFAGPEVGELKSFGVVAQLIERYVRIVEVVGLSPISSTTLRVCDASCGRPQFASMVLRVAESVLDV